MKTRAGDALRAIRSVKAPTPTSATPSCVYQAWSSNLTTHRFERIQQRFGIGYSAIAILELSKGKLTSAPDRCGGHGLFFTSRKADVFDLHANH